MYWNNPYPLGTIGTATEDIIDIDECGLFFESSNRGFGKVKRGRRCDQKWIYNRAGQKLNLPLAICGDNNDPMRFSHKWPGEGTTLLIYYNFIRSIIDELERRHPGRLFCFTKDELNVLKNPIIMDLISNAGHRVVFRAPYYAYVFNTVQTNLMVEYNNLYSLDDLRNTVNLIIGAIPTFRPYLDHVGFN